MPVPTRGAQRASRHPLKPSRRSRSLIGSLLAATILASLIAIPASATAGSTVRIPTVTALTTTSVDRTWYSEEMFIVGLINCDRTGGWVLSNGTCRGWGSGRYSPYVPGLRIAAGLSDSVSRPYARYLAVKNLCSHYVGGTPGDRLTRVGYRPTAWGENIGCRDGYSLARTAVLISHLVFQSERSTNGGHWRNIKNPRFKYMGVGVWRYGTRTRLVTDFYAGS